MSSFRNNIKFPAHTQEKLDEINYYYKTWFKIVKNQKAYIVDAFAGTGYVEIGGNKKIIAGSALIAVDLFKKDDKNNLNLVFTNINIMECDKLKKNVSEYLLRNKISKDIISRIQIIEGDWSDSICNLNLSTQDGISLFLLDPYGIDSLPWSKVENLIKRGKSEFGHKESGFEVLINWAWHTIRRQIGKYFTEENFERKSLDNFFNPVAWRKIVDKYPKNIFKDNLDDKVEELRKELLLAYIRNFFNYFKYVKIHDVFRRKKSKDIHYQERGKIVYSLIFASNYYDALDIIDIKFKQYRDTKIYSSLPRGQKDLSEFIQLKSKKQTIKKSEIINIDKKIKNLEEELGDNLFSKSKEIIKFLYRRKNYDYGCFDFVLFNKFKINKSSYIPYFLKKNIIQVRNKKSKSGLVGKYYYLSHPRLIDRGEYLFFNDKRYFFTEGRFKEF